VSSEIVDLDLNVSAVGLDRALLVRRNQARQPGYYGQTAARLDPGPGIFLMPAWETSTGNPHVDAMRQRSRVSRRRSAGRILLGVGASRAAGIGSVAI